MYQESINYFLPFFFSHFFLLIFSSKIEIGKKLSKYSFDTFFILNRWIVYARASEVITYLLTVYFSLGMISLVYLIYLWNLIRHANSWKYVKRIIIYFHNRSNWTSSLIIIKLFLLYTYNRHCCKFFTQTCGE